MNERRNLMAQESEQYIDEIVKELLNGTFSVFCGSGADYDATHQLWQDIFCEKTKEFYKDNLSSDIYFLADLEKTYHNATKFLDNVCMKLTEVSNNESKHIDHIIDLNLNQIWTTNYDTIIENTIYRKLKIHPTVIKESKDLFTENLNSQYLIYKLNGCVSCPETMILTKSDYLSYFKKQRLLFEMLKRQLVLDSFLFVGYSFSDNLVLNALREIKDVFPQRGKTHYRFQIKDNKSSESQQEFINLESNYYFDYYNIKTINISHYNDIDIYLQKVYERFCHHNVLIAGSFRYLKDNKQRIYIENLISLLIQRLTENGFNIYSGNGRGLGEIVVAQIKNHNADKQFVNRPLIFTEDTIEQKMQKNTLIMKDCDTMIIICGQDDTLNSSKNVIKQFQSFIKTNDKHKYPLVIPIPSTGYAANEIFNSNEFQDNNAYLSNKNIFEQLKETSNIDEIVNIIINLVRSYRSI